MSRSLRSLVCAVSMLAVATGAAHAQTAPTAASTTTTPPSGEFTLPAACQPSNTDTDENHGQAVRACVEALRAELGDDHGLGEWVSQFAHDADDVDDHDAQSVTTPSTPSTTGTTTTVTPTTIVTPTTSATSGETGEHGHGHGHHGQKHDD